MRWRTIATSAGPTGAFFGVWEAAAHRGSELVNEPGTVVWNELVTTDLDTAAAFYAATWRSLLLRTFGDELSVRSAPHDGTTVEVRLAAGDAA